MDFKVSTTAVDGAALLLVAIEGDLDIGSADQLAKPAEVAVNADCALVVDLSLCTFIDSTGLRSLLQAHRALADAGGSMAVVAPHSQVRKMLSLTSIDARIRVFSTCGEAIESLRTVEAQVLAAPSPTASTNGGSTTSSP